MQQKELQERYMGFPSDLTYREFLHLPSDLREEIVKRNRVLQTDTYNRTMNHAKGIEWCLSETYVLQMRKAPRGYLIAYGIRRMLERLFSRPISQSEVQFAKDFYQSKAKVPYFNEEMWDMVLGNGGRMPLEIDSVEDGTALLPSDPIMRVRGPGELAVHFEPDFHRVFYSSLVATDAHLIAQKIGANRFVEFGKRGTNTEEMHMIALDATEAGGGIKGTSNDAAVAAHPDELRDVGTIGHRFIQFTDTEEEAFRRAIESTQSCSLLIDLTNSYRGIDLALGLKQEYHSTGKRIWIRLDSGNLFHQASYALTRFQQMGFTDPALDKIVIEDLSSLEDMLQIDQALQKVFAGKVDIKQHVIYGAGSLLTTKEKGRGDASTGFKLSGVEREGLWMPKMKFSDSPGKESLPGTPTLVYAKTRRRIIAQVGEFLDMEDLLVPAYRVRGGVLFKDDHGGVRRRVDETYEQIQSLVGQTTPLSPKTQQLAAALRAHYRLPSLP